MASLVAVLTPALIAASTASSLCLTIVCNAAVLRTLSALAVASSVVASLIARLAARLAARLTACLLKSSAFFKDTSAVLIALSALLTAATALFLRSTASLNLLIAST